MTLAILLVEGIGKSQIEKDGLLEKKKNGYHIMQNSILVLPVQI